MTEQEAVFDIERLADAIHKNFCGIFASMDPQQCVYGRDRDVAAARTLVNEYTRLGEQYDSI